MDNTADLTEISSLNVVAQRFMDCLAVADGPFVLALPGGRSIVPMLEALRQALPQVSDAARSRLHIFMADERCVPQTDAQHNSHVLRQHLLDEVFANALLAESQFHPYVFATDPNGVERYQLELQHYGGRFSAVVLGVGPDGHVASLFPHHPSSGDRTSTGYITVQDSPKPPPNRISASVRLIQSADLAVALFVGPDKKAAYEKFVSGAAIAEVPVAVVRGIREAFVYRSLAGH